MIEDIYKKMLDNYSDTLEKTSEDNCKPINDKYMTSCKKTVVNVDKFKNDFVKNMSLSEKPKSCDALYMTNQNEYFMIEFKNGKIDNRMKYEIIRKIYESLLMISEKFSETTDFMRNNMNFILVYNENVTDVQEQYGNTGVRQVSSAMYKLTSDRVKYFGLNRFKKLYFKDVFTYTKKEFETEFVSKYCV